MALPNVYQAAAAQRKLLLAGEKEASQLFRGRWLFARVSIEAELNQVIANVERATAAGKTLSFGRETATTFSRFWLYETGRLGALIDQIDHETQRFTNEAKAFTQLRGETLVALGLQNMGDLLNFATGTPGVSPRQFGPANVDAVNRLIGAFAPGGPVPRAFDGFGPELLDKVQQAMVTGLAKGLNPRVIGRDIVGVVANDNSTGGLLDLPRYKADRVARTEPFRAYRESGREMMKANGDVVPGWEWGAFPGPRTCAMCLAMDGSYHTLDERLASHPHCRCVQLPVTDLSQVRALTGEVYFSRLTAHEQDQILHSHELGELYRQGDVKLIQLVNAYEHPKWGPSANQKSLTALHQQGAVTQSQIDRAHESHTPPRPLPLRPSGNVLELYPDAFRKRA